MTFIFGWNSLIYSSCNQVSPGAPDFHGLFCWIAALFRAGLANWFILGHQRIFSPCFQICFEAGKRKLDGQRERRKGSQKREMAEGLARF